jgi:hypothetical protein
MQASLLEATQAGELLNVKRDESGAVLIEDGGSGGSVDDLLREIEHSMARERQRLARMLDTQALRTISD